MRSRIPFVVALMVFASTEVMSGEPPLAALGPPVSVPYPRGIVPVYGNPWTKRALPPSEPSTPSDRTSIHFSGPAGMKVMWLLSDGSFNEADALVAPKEYNFLQGQSYRLQAKVASASAAGRTFYPTLEVAPATAKSKVFLAHASVPLAFSADDFAQAADGVDVVKVVYLPDPAHQDFSTVAGTEEVTSYRLEPGIDPTDEARRRGTILAVVRLGRVEMEKPRPPRR